MKIVHVIMSLNIGGAELMLKRLVLNSHQKEKFEHTVITLTDLGVMGPELQNKGIMVHTLGMKSLSTVPLVFLKLQRLLKKIQPDVVQTWMYHSDLLGGLAAKSVGVKKIIWGIRTTDVSQGPSKLTVHLSKVCAKLSYYIPSTIVCAAHVSKDYHVGIGYDESKMVVIPNGFDIEALSATDEDGLEIRQQNNLSVDDIVIGSVGRFNPVKNQKLFIDVAALLVEKNPNLKFLMVGRDNTIENKELMSWINDYNIVDSFRLLGQRDDVAKCLKAIDILCLHSKTEGFPNVLVEAMILKTFIISNDVGEVRALIPSNQIITLNKVNYYEKILNIMDNNYFRSKENLDNLKESSIAKYSIGNIVLQYEKIYEEL
ncbi:glycosyltransferase family 4 protein [Psychrobacter immobilis]|uniref:glycosyltransferase family 4 protein n=1 Tax=Psychrobacter immobilis TaxID=498 RepID=UPI0019188C90|nr:glycosyltransferase [Psychrobacter immobilis]